MMIPLPVAAGAPALAGQLRGRRLRAGPVHERGCLFRFARSYPGEPAQAGRVRAALALLLDGCTAADDAILIASELASNAAVHSRSAIPTGWFTVRAGACPGRHVWVAVQDQGGPWSGRAQGDGRPHGLDLVGLLALEWGIGGDGARGRTVWAVLDWQSDAAPVGRQMASAGQTSGTLRHDTTGGMLS